MPRTRRLIGGRGRALHALLRVLSAVLPVARHVPDGSVQPQQRRPHEHAAARWRGGARRRAHAAGVAGRGGLSHLAHRQVPQRLRAAPPARRAAGLDGLARHRRQEHVPDVRLQDVRERAASTRYGNFDVEDPALYQTDVLRQKAVGTIEDTAPSIPLFLSLMFVAPHGEVENPGSTTQPYIRPRHARRRALPAPAPPARVARRARRPRQAALRAQAAPREPRDRGAHPRRLPLAPRVADRGRRGGRGRGGRARAHGAARTRPTSSSPPTTASSRASTGSPRASTSPTTRPRTCRC